MSVASSYSRYSRPRIRRKTFPLHQHQTTKKNNKNYPLSNLNPHLEETQPLLFALYRTRIGYHLSLFFCSASLETCLTCFLVRVRKPRCEMRLGSQSPGNISSEGLLLGMALIYKFIFFSFAKPNELHGSGGQGVRSILKQSFHCLLVDITFHYHNSCFVAISTNLVYFRIHFISQNLMLLK